jgi:hypothetical protein
VETIYSACDRDLDDYARSAVAAFVDANPKGQFGTHGYRLGDFGLRVDDLRERFSAYVEQYDIPVENSTAV